MGLEIWESASLLGTKSFVPTDMAAFYTQPLSLEEWADATNQARPGQTKPRWGRPSGRLVPDSHYLHCQQSSFSLYHLALLSGRFRRGPGRPITTARASGVPTPGHASRLPAPSASPHHAPPVSFRAGHYLISKTLPSSSLPVTMT